MDADNFITRWAGIVGSERQNSQSFLNDLCDLLSLDKPSPHTQGEYVFERPAFPALECAPETGRIEAVTIDRGQAF